MYQTLPNIAGQICYIAKAPTHKLSSYQAPLNLQFLLLLLLNLIPIQRIDLDFSAPKRPRSHHSIATERPGISHLPIGKVLDIAFVLDLGTLEFPARVRIDLALNRSTKVRIVRQQGLGLHLGGFGGVDGLEDYGFQAVCACCEAVAAHEDDGVRRFGGRVSCAAADLRGEGRAHLLVEEAR
jgi:hypothetical protein